MPMISKETDAVVLANGEYPTAEIPLLVLKEAPYVACCDGGANIYISKGNRPDIIIGDGDSLKEEYRIKYADIIERISEQENNDLTKAVLSLHEQGKKNIAIVGATGKREDHTIGNISLLLEYARKGIRVRMYTDYGVFIPCKETTSLKLKIGQQISIFNFTGSGFTSKGLRYPIYDFNNWWQGTLNETTDEDVEITANGEYILFVNYK